MTATPSVCAGMDGTAPTRFSMHFYRFLFGLVFLNFSRVVASLFFFSSVYGFSFCLYFQFHFPFGWLLEEWALDIQQPAQTCLINSNHGALVRWLVGLNLDVQSKGNPTLIQCESKSNISPSPKILHKDSPLLIQCL